MREVHNLHHFFAVGVRIFAAGLRSILIDGSVIISTEEGAWCGTKDMIVVFVDAKIPGDEIARLHT